MAGNAAWLRGDDISQSEKSSIFQDKLFWLSQNVPSRKWFVQMIQLHGGFVTAFEKNADIKLVDHARRNLPPDSYSYQFVERSVKKGALENLEDYRIGSRPQRPVGATWIPNRTQRLAYTLEEDQMIWDYMQHFEKTNNRQICGLKIYQDVAEKFPRHSYQSWRDRYLKRLRGLPRPGGSIPAATGRNQTRQSPQLSEGTKDASDNRLPASAGQSQPPGSTERTHPVPSQKTVEAPPVSSSPAIPQTDITAQEDTELVSIGEQGSQKRKRSSGDIGLHESLASDHKYYANQKRRLLGPIAETVTSAPISRNPDSEQSESHQKALDLTKHDAEPKRDYQATSELRHEKEPAKESNNTLDMLIELPFFPSSPKSDGNGEDEGDGEETQSEQDIDTWIDTRVRTGKARNVVQVIEALRCTSMDPRLADKVLGYLVVGKGIPKDIPGVWTTEEDKIIEGNEARSIERIYKKHGQEFFNARWEYLGLARNAGLEKDVET